MTQIKNEILLKKMALVIKELRQNKNISQNDFFVDTGIHIGRIEQGKRNISIITISTICSYFEISLLDFIHKIENLN